MNIKEKIGIIYAIHDCSNRSCANCVAHGMCGSVQRKNELFAELRNDIDYLIKERDEAIAKLKENQMKTETKCEHGHYVVYADRKFYCSAGTYGEAEREMEGD